MLQALLDRIATFVSWWFGSGPARDSDRALPASARQGQLEMIAPPRMPGDYARRGRDCEQAIERLFLAETVNSTSPYVDLERALATVIQAGRRAGWSEEELTDAALRLAGRHGLRRRGRAD